MKVYYDENISICSNEIALQEAYDTDYRARAEGIVFTQYEPRTLAYLYRSFLFYLRFELFSK